MYLDVPDPNRGQRTLAAIMLTDAVGFSARMSIDEEQTLSLIRRDQRLMELLCQQHEGRAIKSTGDGLLMYFASAVQAVSCGIAIQKELAKVNQNAEVEQALLHRIGIHLGDVFFSQSDVMGNGVNIAARLQTEAHPGGVCISQVVYDVVKQRLSLNATYAGPLQLKNIKEPLPAYHLQLETEALSPSTEPEPGRESLAPGTKVGGRYIVQRVLGQGGFGRSYLGEDTQRFGEACVLKEFFPTNKSRRSLQKALDLFKREAKTLYQIDHPQVPKFMACFTQGQRLFIVQEFIDGTTYSQLLRQRKREGSAFSEAEVTRWLMHMLQVLDYLHGLNVVHRDISPDNIIYCPERDLPVLIDFGLVNDAFSSLLSEHTNIQESDGELRGATMVGKFGYSPPEQMHLGQCFPCSDLYALGVTAIVLLTGKYPRDLVDQDSLEWQWRRHVAISGPLANLLNRMIRQKPKERYQVARDVLQTVVALVPEAASPLPQTAPAPIDLTVMPAEAAPLYAAPLQMGETPAQNRGFIERCRQELMRFVGPIASVLVEDVLEQHPQASPQQLVDLLASQLSDGSQATDFVSRLRDAEEPASGSQSSGSAGVSGGASGSPSRFDAPAGGVSADFLERCRRELTRCVGPMAEYLIDEVLTDYPNLPPSELVQRLSAEIPDAQKAQQFQRQLR